jgi:hypothetical protein
MTQGIDKQVRAFTPVESKAHFFQVGREMLCADLMPRSDDPALEKREGRFDRVRVNVAIHVHAVLVFDRLVLGAVDASFDHRLGIGREFVGEDNLDLSIDVFLDVFGQCAGLCVLRMEESKIAAALTNADHNFFVVIPVLNRTLITADVGFVHFDFPGERKFFSRRHSLANAMAEVPGRLVRHADCTFDLKCANSLFGLTHQQRRGEPLDERQMGIMKNGASGYGELIITLHTEQDFGVRCKPRRRCVIAAWAHGAIRPAKPFQQFSALYVTAKSHRKINERHGDFL